MHLSNGQIIDIVLSGDNGDFQATVSVDLVKSDAETLCLTPLTSIEDIGAGIDTGIDTEAATEQYDLFMLDKQMRLWQEVYQQDRCKQTADDAVKHFNQAFKQ